MLQGLSHDGADINIVEGRARPVDLVAERDTPPAGWPKALVPSRHLSPIIAAAPPKIEAAIPLTNAPSISGGK